MTAIIKYFTYTKDNGEVSERAAVDISPPKKNHLMLDVTDLSEEDKKDLVDALEIIDKFRDTMFSELSHLIKWRTFKPEGIVYKTTEKV